MNINRNRIQEKLINETILILCNVLHNSNLKFDGSEVRFRLYQVTSNESVVKLKKNELYVHEYADRYLI